MRYKKKPKEAVAFMLALAFMLTNCAAAFGVSGAAEDDFIISRYYGSTYTVDGKVLYDIAIKQLGENQYVIDLQFYDYDSKKQIQQLSYALRDDFMPETVHNPIQIYDVNIDGSYDIIIDLGIYGKIRLALCYIYDSDKKGYVKLAGFDELMTPSYKQGYVFEEWRGDATEYGINKYGVYGNEMVLVASLYWKYGGNPNPAYTEKILIDGEMVTVKENVPEEEIDFREWY